MTNKRYDPIPPLYVSLRFLCSTQYEVPIPCRKRMMYILVVDRPLQEGLTALTKVISQAEGRGGL